MAILHYPKPLMSITELVNAMGFSRTDLKRYSQSPDFPCEWTSNGGKILVRTGELDAWILEFQKRMTKAGEINQYNFRRYRKRKRA